MIKILQLACYIKTVHVISSTTLVLSVSVRVVSVGTGTPRFFTIFFTVGGFIGRIETSEEAKLEIKCEERGNQQDATIRCLLSTSVSTCFGHHYAHLQENKDRVNCIWCTALVLLDVVGSGCGRCVVGCEQCSHPPTQRLHELMWRNTIQRGRRQITIWRMRIACWVPKATDTLRLWNTYVFCTVTVVARTRLNIFIIIYFIIIFFKF